MNRYHFLLRDYPMRGNPVTTANHTSWYLLSTNLQKPDEQPYKNKQRVQAVAVCYYDLSYQSSDSLWFERWKGKFAQNIWSQATLFLLRPKMRRLHFFPAAFQWQQMPLLFAIQRIHRMHYRRLRYKSGLRRELDLCPNGQNERLRLHTLLYFYRESCLIHFSWKAFDEPPASV